ncbi:M64 family metallopeptidase [archaeon]|nr:M64 family metallopeptidase [archaeon]
MDYGERSRRSWIPFIVLVVLVLGAFGYIFFGNGLINSNNVRQPVQPSPGCIVMYEGGAPEDSIDIVFLPDNYDDVSKFREKTEELVESFLQTIPYNNYKDRFNFFRVEEFGLNLDCDYNYGGDAIVCNPSAMKLAATRCPSDYPIVVVDTSGIQKFYELLRSSSWMGTASLNSADDPLVFAHEFAHSAFDFADEYVFGGDIKWDAPNCDSSWRVCPKFKVVEGSECVRGCVNEEHSRSVETGIMRDYWKSNRYGLYNEYCIEKDILEFTNGPKSNEIRKSMPLYSVKLELSNGEWVVNEINEINGFPDGENTGFSDSVVLLDSSGKEIGSVGLPSNRLFIDGHAVDGSISQMVVEPVVGEYVVNLLRVDDVDKVAVKQNGKVVSLINLDGVSSSSGGIDIPVTYSV